MAPAGESLAGLYALAATCEGNSLNPKDYLAELSAEHSQLCLAPLHIPNRMLSVPARRRQHERALGPSSRHVEEVAVDEAAVAVQYDGTPSIPSPGPCGRRCVRLTESGRPGRRSLPLPPAAPARGPQPMSGHP